MKRFSEENYDFIVVGGGMAGLCAAISAARHGTKTALIHARPVLGGNASSEIRIHISGADQSLRQTDYAEGGLVYEMMLDNKACNDSFCYSVWDSVLFEKAKKEKNLTVYFNTVMYDAELAPGTNRIASISCVQETTEMRYRFTAPLFADCTGNGTLGYYVGADFRQGSESKAQTGEPHAPDEPNNERMGNTILLKAVDTGHPVKFTPPSYAKKLDEHQLRYRVHSKTMKVDASMAPDPEEWLRLSACSCKAVDYGYWWLELMGDGDDIIPDYEKIRDDLYAYAYGIWDHIKNGGEHGAENYTLQWVGALPGMRESRRLMGDYVLSESDILDHRIFDDAVAYGGWCVDLHAPHGLLDFDLLPSDCHHFTGIYTIPYRSYYSRNIDNLFMAGRDISTTKLGLASTRILGCCAIGGQAVGTAAALCRKYGTDPRGLAPHVPELRQILMKDDIYFPAPFTNDDEGDFARSAVFTASSVSAGSPDMLNNGVSRKIGDCLNGWKSDGIAEGGEELLMKFGKVRSVSQTRVTFDSNFAYPVRITMSANRQEQQRPGVPMELVKDYDIVLLLDGKEVGRSEVRDNHQRLSVTDFGRKIDCDSIKFVFRSTNGAPDVTVYEVRAY
ncbi:MAG: FAD-dependent oxidoreductase [Clostridia bacterium]|nr:FAD-dependent oxidoreductase [Clostridia bacterium]